MSANPVHDALDARSDGLLCNVSFHGGCRSYKAFRRQMRQSHWEKISHVRASYFKVSTRLSRQEIQQERERVLRIANHYVRGVGGSSTIIVSASSRPSSGDVHNRIPQEEETGSTMSPLQQRPDTFPYTVRQGNFFAAAAAPDEIDVHPFWIGQVVREFDPVTQLITVRWMTPVNKDANVEPREKRTFRFYGDKDDLCVVHPSAIIRWYVNMIPKRDTEDQMCLPICTYADLCRKMDG